MRKYISLAFAIFLLTTPLSAEKAKSNSIKQLMEKTGAKNLGSQMIKQMLPTLKKLAPNAPKIFWKKTILKMDMNKMIELIIPVYQKHLTEKDIQTIIKFYDTPVGKKFIKVTPAITQETMIIGQQWGQSIAMEIIQELKKEGHIR